DLGVEVALRAIFENPTIGEFCDLLPELRSGAFLPPIEVLPRGAGLPLSYAQQRLWFIDRLEGESSHYNVPGAARVKGSLDKGALAAAFRTIVERHESLRTVFREVDGEVVQVIRDGAAFHLEERDLSGLAAEEREREVRRLALEDARRPFDLSNDLLLRVELLTLSETEHVALFNMHHIASDGWSMSVLMRELGTLYEAFRAGAENPLPPLRVQYADYARWQRQWLQGEVLESQLAYWRRQLAGLPVVHRLPLDKPRPPRQGFEGGQHVRRMGPELKERMEALARESGVTLFMLLQAAFATLLGRYSQEPDVVMGLPIAGRVHRDVEPLIGFFVNTLVLRSDLAGDPRFADVLEKSRQTILDAYAHQHLPFEMLVGELRPERSLSHSPLFQILCVLQNAERGDAGLGGSLLEAMEGSISIVKFDLELNVLELADGLSLSWWYKQELFFAETIERLAASFEALLAGILERPEARVDSQPLLREAERAALLHAWSGREGWVPADRSIPAWFEAQVRRAPSSVALVFGEGVLTYAELNGRANHLARVLRAEGVGVGTLVGVCAERSAEMLVGLLGILKAGGAYVPLDPEYPEARLSAMLDDCGVAVVLTAGGLAGLGCFAGRRTLDLEVAGAAGPDLASAEPPVGPGDLAYVIYTSGSTGRPKGVMVEHRSVVRLVVGSDFVPLDGGTVMLQASSASFDAATLEIWGALLNGGRLVLYPERVPEVGRLNEVLSQHGVNTMWLTAGLFEQWSHQLPASCSLRRVLTGGDVVDPQAVARVQSGLAGVEVINGYGPTENTTFTTCHAIPRDHDPRRPLPLGRPIRGTGVYLLQPGGEPAPPGAVGEIHALGEGLSRGYLGRPDLTAEKFVADPHAEEGGSRLYRTGDLGRLRPDGTLEFLGRMDAQLKLRGFRVEPGEIEAQLLSQPAVREAVVVVRGGGGLEKRLVGYVVPSQSVDASSFVAELRSFLRRVLPDYMVPSALVVLESLPLTKNGKVDRGALPAPEEGSYGRGTYVAPRTELERRLCAIWEELLGVEGVGIDDSFFDLGGHSLLATRLVSRVRSVLGRELPLRALFEHPTVGELCERLPELSGGWVLPPIAVQAQREGLPLSYAQQRLWFIDRLEGGSSHYNIPAAVRVQGDLAREAFSRALGTIVARHESLRTVFREVEGRVVQVIQESSGFSLGEEDLSGLPPEEREREVRRRALADARRPFDLSRDRMLRASLLKLADDEHVVLLNMHHIASDGWSMGLLRRELGALYAAYRAGAENPLPPLPVQYADYACWQREWLQGEVLDEQLGYWRRRLDSLPAVHNLPLDELRPAREGFSGGQHVERLGGGIRESIEALGRRCGATLFMTLQAAFAVFLGRTSQEEDIVMGSPIAGRVHRDLEPLIGFFVNTLVLRTDLADNPRFVDLLAAGKQSILDAYAHQHVPFEMLVEELRPERSLSHSPLFQILFVLQNTERGGPGLGGLRAEPLAASGGIVKLDLELNVAEEQGLVFHWLYKKDLFEAATVERMAVRLGILLDGLLSHPEARVQDLPLLGASDRSQLS
ncbi:MAG TPA: non-ribosomal peptide synthetase, partial [Acidobacteria bacterium]|nr:non-ribosomal peptide synthetase [Acidobacteriota bacterium]